MPKKDFKKVADDNPALAFLGKQPNVQKTDIKQTINENLIEIDLLVPYANHPFKLYEGERFADMIRSVKEMGILLPIIVRPAAEPNKYEILSGHNRVNAAREAGLLEVPAIIKNDLTDDEAELIVTETNFVQRSFADLIHSERAITLKRHMDAIKSQGKRNDLINEINMLLNPGETGENDKVGLIAQSSNSRDKVAGKYGMDGRSVSRYIRLCELNKLILDRVDNEEIGLYPAVSISYLSSGEQTELNRVLDTGKYKIDIKKAETLREVSENKKLTNDKILQIVSGEFNKKSTQKSAVSFIIKKKMYLKYFTENMNESEVASIVDLALEEYFEKRKNT